MTTTATESLATDTHGNTRDAELARARAAYRTANRRIGEAFLDGADDREPSLMADAREALDRARTYRDAIADADLDGIADATPTTYADLAAEYAGTAYDAATAALD